METILRLASDERTSRVILAMASEPSDSVTGRMVRTAGATETIARALSAEVPVGLDGDTWQRRIAPRIDAEQARRVLAETERHGMRVLIPGDTDWPAKTAAILGLESSHRPQGRPMPHRKLNVDFCDFFASN